jgi:predicted nucleotidyltransferase
LESHIGEIRLICQKNKAKSLYVFESVLKGRFTDKSDIDLLESRVLKNPYLINNIKYKIEFLGRILMNNLLLI